MAVRYRCKHCGHILYEFKGIKQGHTGLLSPSEVAKLLGYICPRCKSVLDASNPDSRSYIIARPSVKFKIPVSIPESMGMSKSAILSTP